jgi:hypothetical protein
MSPMRTPLLLLALILACGEADPPPEQCDQPLPPTDEDGVPWPTYTGANAALADCEQYPGQARRSGTCSDGKTLLAREGGFSGETYYFRGEALIGLERSPEYIVSCVEYRFGDTRCDDAQVQELTCP